MLHTAEDRVGHGATKTFHSIRRTVVHPLEGAGVPENLTADIAGHNKTTMSYGLYSGRFPPVPVEEEVGPHCRSLTRLSALVEQMLKESRQAEKHLAAAG